MRYIPTIGDCRSAAHKNGKECRARTRRNDAGDSNVVGWEMQRMLRRLDYSMQQSRRPTVESSAKSEKKKMCVEAKSKGLGRRGIERRLLVSRET